MEKKRPVSIQLLLVIIYGVVYIYLWKLFLEIKQSSFLKPYALIWIISAFLCFFISKDKKHLPFLGFFVGSIFGPLGILMCLFSRRDIRSLDKKDKIFYQELFNDLEKIYGHILSYEKNNIYIKQLFRQDAYKICEKLDRIADILGVKLSLNTYLERLMVLAVVEISPTDLMKELLKIYLALDKEYSSSFGSTFNLVNNRIEDIGNILKNESAPK